MRFLFTLFLLIPLLVAGQSFRPPINNYSPRDYGSKNNPENWCVVQDGRGVIYVGNYNGVLEYDGHDWHFIVVKPGANVVSMADDPQSNRIYVGSIGEFGYLEPNDVGDMQFVSLSDSLPKDVSSFGVVWKTWATADQVYFQAEEHLYIFHPASENITTITPEDSYHTSFLCDGNFYVRERGIGIRVLEGDEFKTLPGTDFLAERGVFAILPFGDRTGELFIVTQEEGFWTYDPHTQQFAPIGEWSWFDLAGKGIIGGIRLANGNYAINTLLAGVVILDDRGEIIEFLDKDKGIRSNDVKAIFEDRDNNLWLATQNGISKVVYNSPLSYYQEDAGIEGGVEAVYRLENELFVGTSSGLFASGHGWSGATDFAPVQGIQSQVWTIERVGDILYVGASDGLYAATIIANEFGQEELLVDYSNVNSPVFERVVEFNTNAVAYVEEFDYLIIAGSGGIAVFTHSTMSLYQYEQAQFSRVSSIAVDPIMKNDYVEAWIGTSGMGAVRLQLDDFGFMMDRFDELDGLEDEWVRPLNYDDKVVFATNRGVQFFVHESEVRLALPDSLKGNPDYERGYFDAFELNDSVFSVPVTYVLHDATHIWATIDNQVSYFDVEDSKWHHRPFWGIDFNRINVLYQEDDGTLWIGAADGLIRYHKENTKDYESHYQALIRKVMIGDSTIWYGFMPENPSYDEPEMPARLIEYKDNSIHFYFAAPYFEDDHKIEYSWILEGADEEWSEWTITHDFPYSNLHEGDYVFKVRAKNVYGNISEIAEYHFTIAPPWYRTSWAYTMYIIALIVVIYITVKVSAYNLKKKNQRLEEIVAERTQEIANQNVELEQQRDEILHQKEEITDSINYAKRIQRAILPPDGLLREYLPQSFILFKPKDIVSGDFYWMEHIGNQVFFAAADCTGHGVPGAMVSVVCSNALNRTVLEFGITDTGKILDKVTDLVIETFEKSDEEVKDGMDIALCCLDKDTGVMKFSGANNPLWIVTATDSDTARALGEANIVSEDGSTALFEVRATKQPVGKYAERKAFESNEVKLNPEDTVYLFSDGFADQFGGDRGKKYKYRPFKRFLMTLQTHEMDKRHEIIDEEFEKWRGDFEQIDDVVVIGVKL